MRGRRILDGEAKRSPEPWRDPDVGPVSFLQCDAAEQPSFKSIATMLHETNHRLSPDRCLFDFESGGEICFTLPRGLPEGTIAAYPRAPRQLDRDSAEWFAHVR